MGKCTDKEWQHCRVEKMGCEGCYYNKYNKYNDLELANEFANLTSIYGGKIVLTLEQMKSYQKAVRKLIERNEELEKYYKCERNLLNSYIHKDKIKEILKKPIMVLGKTEWYTKEQIKEILEGDN